MPRACTPQGSSSLSAAFRLLLVGATTAGRAAHGLAAVSQQQRGASRSAVRLRSTASDAPAQPKQVLVPIADGSEEIETTCISDTLVRAGAAVTIASANADGSTTVTMARGVRILADAHVDDVAASRDWDLVAIPGGMPGAANLAASATLAEVLTARNAAAQPFAAVCASPAVVLKPLGLLDGRDATCYPAPGFVEALGGATAPGDVVVDGHVVTSRGPGTSLKFALTLVEQLYGADKRRELATQMLVADE